MGQCFSGSSAFDDIGPGRTLASSSTPHHPPQPTNKPSKKYTTLSSPPQSSTGGLSSHSSTGGVKNAAGGKDRETMAAAAELRSQAAANRGGGGGKLSKQLQAQSADGGRKEEALRIADSKQRGEPIVDSFNVLTGHCQQPTTLSTLQITTAVMQELLDNSSIPSPPASTPAPTGDSSSLRSSIFGIQ